MRWEQRALRRVGVVPSWVLLAHLNRIELDRRLAMSGDRYVFHRPKDRELASRRRVYAQRRAQRQGGLAKSA